MSKHHYKTIMLLPLMALLLSGCYEIIPEDAPEVSEDEFTPEGSYSVSEEDTSESSSIPYESTGGTDESTGGDSSSTPSETPGEGSSSSSSGSSSSTPSETHEYSYSLQINNKEDLASLTLDENDSSSNIYTLSISLISYDYDIQLSCETASEDDVTITSSNEAAVKVDGLTLIPQVGGGETTINATWNLHSEATDSFAVTVDYIPYTPTESYEYKLVIENKAELGSTWKITDTRQNVDHTLEVKLYEYKYLDGDLADDYPIVKDASLSDVNISFTDDSVLGISTDSISLYPMGVGSTGITLTWIEHPEASDTFSVIVEEVTYEYNHTLAITNAADFAYTDDDNVWRVGDSYKTLSVSLTSTTYTGSTDTSEESRIDGDSSNVSVSFTPEEGSPENGLTNWGLNLMANSAGTYTVTATWIGHEEATDSITVTIKEKTSTSYTMSVSSDDKSNMEKAWYVEDEESRSFSIDITADDGDGVDLPYSDSDIIVLHSSTELEIDSEVSGGTITITPVGITSDVSVTLFVYWSLHSEAHITLTLSLNQHAYEIEISNSEQLMQPWTISEEARTAEIALTKDNEPYSQSAYVTLVAGGTNPEAISINDLTITPVSEGSVSVTAIWYKYDPTDPTYTENNVVYASSEAVTLSIDDDTKPASIELSVSEITFNAYYDTQEVTARVLDSTGKEATEQGVTWEADNPGVVISGEGNTITIGVSQYNIENATLTCTSAIDTDVVATCTVSIGDQPNPNGPQTGDTTYKLGCKHNGTYLFFTGSKNGNYLAVTEDWDQAVDVYMSPNEYEIPDDIYGQGYTLSFYSDNTLEYIAAPVSDSNSSNVNISTTPGRWLWNGSRFSAPTDSNRYLGTNNGTDFRMYANTGSYDAVIPYSEIPDDYTYGSEEEPETGDDEEEGLIGKLDFSSMTGSSGSPSTSDIDACWTGDSSKYSGCQTASTIYTGNSSGGDLTGSGFIRASSSGTNGEIVLKFALGVDVDKVVINAQAWSSSESSKISVNGSATQSVNVGSYSELTYELSGDYVNTVTIDFTKRSYVNSIKIYGTYDDSVSQIESLSLNAEKTALDIGDEVDITVSWTPYDTPYDVDDLTWESNDSNVASVSKTSTGATVHALSEGTATITATTSYSVFGSIEITVNAASAGQEITMQVTYQTIMELDKYEGHTWSGSQDVISSTTGEETDFVGCSITWYTGTVSGASSNGCCIYNASSLRFYRQAYFEINALEGYAIEGVVLNLTSANSSLSISNATKTNSSGTYTLSAPTDSSLPITVLNDASSSNTITFADAGIIIYLVTI